MSRGQTDSWHGLLDLAELVPDHWCVVGGQMVYLHCIERGSRPTRPTDDGDAVLDIRARPTVLMDVTSALQKIGFEPSGESATGHQHRWVRRLAQIDLLIPSNVGVTAASRRGVTGGTTLEAPGAQQALDRSEQVEIVMGDRRAIVARPTLLGALVAKAAAYTVMLDRARKRHLIDFVVLATLADRRDRIAELVTKRDRHYLSNALGALTEEPGVVQAIEGGADGVERIRVALG